MQQQEFARRLFQALQKKGWTQSDLARRAFGSTKDSSGYSVAKGRDRISVYIRGKQLPEPKQLQRIASVLGLTPEELAPELFQSAIDRENPEISVHAAAGHPDKMHLVINKVVPAAIASRILALLTDDESFAR
jgi:transcriptional regulator with XRE-family HTH domain